MEIFVHSSESQILPFLTPTLNCNLWRSAPVIHRTPKFCNFYCKNSNHFIVKDLDMAHLGNFLCVICYQLKSCWYQLVDELV